jgi:hypothetical protein
MSVDRGIADSYNALRIEVDERQTRHQGRNEPKIAKETLAVLRADVAYEKPPSKLARIDEIAQRLARHFSRMAQG